MSRRALVGCAGVLVGLLILGGWFTQPPALEAPASTLQLPPDLDDYLETTEANVASRYGIIEGAQKRIRWNGAIGRRSDVAVIYLHGLSATRQEISPVPTLIAQALDANLFETRLRGHGRQRERLSSIRAEEWLADGVEALTIGAALGDRLLVIGTSTGATLALALAEHPLFERVQSLVFMSPNWGPAAGGTGIATGPYGPQLLRLIAGKEHRWTAANDQQERYWTTRYPTATLVEMYRLVKLADQLTEHAAVEQALLIYSPEDDVVSVPRLLDGFERLPAARKEIERVDRPRSLSKHVLAGSILGPSETAPMVDRIVRFMGDGRVAAAEGPRG
ncbi:MAG: alpha/beta fold hydrolase [Halieaceae bacterium]|nr:alpha/beta fold hydrolase [Halieaceae bacterium]